MGGPIGQTSSTAKGKKPEGEREFRAPKEKVSEQQEEQKDKPEPVKPKFNFKGLKNVMNEQNEANSEANKNLPEIQKKLEREIQIH